MSNFFKGVVFVLCAFVVAGFIGGGIKITTVNKEKIKPTFEAEFFTNYIESICTDKLGKKSSGFSVRPTTCNENSDSDSILCLKVACDNTDFYWVDDSGNKIK